MTPKVSIITICYNVKDELEKTVKSVQSQTYKNVEHIVIDGASTDGTKEYLFTLSEDTIIISEPDKGIYDATNKGALKATGDWLIFMNAGDFFYNSISLQKMVESITCSNTNLIIGDAALSNDTIKKQKISYSYLLFKNLCHQAMLIHSSLFKHGQYDLQYKIVGDNAFLVERWDQLIIQKVDYTVCLFDVTGLSSNPQNQRLAWQEKNHFYKSLEKNCYRRMYATFICSTFVHLSKVRDLWRSLFQ